MISSTALLLTGSVLISLATGQNNPDPQLTGTWSSKSRKVLTGPGFYDPVNDKMFEPELTGISYSFTDDGHYEEAYYRAISNPAQPQCPQGIMQWQHGEYTKNANGSLSLTPLSVDGRQLLSNPCAYSNSIYTRYNQSELFAKFQVYTDPYHNVPRLDLFNFDGSPVNPMYLINKPPQMLPTQTLNPTASSSGSPASTNKPKAKRDFSSDNLAGFTPMRDQTIPMHRQKAMTANADKWWWIGVGMTGIGGVGYFFF
ncbi:Reversal of tor2 lethality [Bachmanniomyces sp. S44760]|nr:Reversal of tor2 lethality [Bachmanniomyces sp. S44760]